MAEVPGSMLTGVTFCCWILLFLHSEARDAIIANFGYFVKTIFCTDTNFHGVILFINTSTMLGTTKVIG